MDEEFITKQLGSLPYRLRRSVEFTAAEVDAASYLRAVLPTRRYFPPAGGWALEYQAIATLVDSILSAAAPVRILELGSGVSTVWLAHAVDSSVHGGHITSLEQSPEYAAKTQAMVEQFGLSEVCSVIHSELVPVRVGDREQEWYDLGPLDDGPFDVLVVDGPFAGNDRMIRYPAVPLLRNRLSGNALILADDTDRPGEAEIVERWQSELPKGALSVVTTLRGSMLLRVAGP